MLDRLQLAASLQQLSDKLFPDTNDAQALAWETYQYIAKDQTFVQRASESQSSFLVPEWRGTLLDTVEISSEPEPYTVIAVDGSQIYPDRHVGGAGCFLLNTGTVTLQYGEKSSIVLESNPRVCLPTDIHALDESLPFSVDLVDLLREDAELEATVRAALHVQKHNPFVLIDGTLIFWNLEGKTPEVRRIFLQRYLAHLHALYTARIPCAGYISFPKSKELINLIKIGLCRFTMANCIPCHATYDTFPCRQVDQLIDTSIIREFVQTGSRSTIFTSTSNIVSQYPAHLRPLFCYLNVGEEIIRLEFPAWVAHDATLLDHVCLIAWDQSRKGQGYPVCLSEAHEQAVVKGPDREFFYHLLAHIGRQSGRTVQYSQKSIKKRGIGI